MVVYILITAAGASTRMRGNDKLLEVVEGMPLLRRQAARALAASRLVGVTLSSLHPERTLAIAGLDIEACVLPDASEGMAASLRHAAKRAPIYGGDDSVTAIMVVPADMPDITAFDMQVMIEAHVAAPMAILRGAAFDGTPGHPVVLPRDVWHDLLALRGDQGARALLVQHASRVIAVALPDRNATTDLDTPEDWATWRAGRSE